MAISTSIHDIRSPLPLRKPSIEIGAEGRLGVQVLIPYEMMYRDDRSGIIDHARERLRHQIGIPLIDHISNRSNPVTVRIAETCERDDFRHSYRVALIVDLCDVIVMRNTIYELPPFEFYTPLGKIPVLEWQCIYCGQVSLVVEHLECRKCGAPRKVLR